MSPVPAWPRALRAAAGQHRAAGHLVRCAPAWRSSRRRPDGRHGIAPALSLVVVLHRRRRPGRARCALQLADIEQLATWCAARPRGDGASAGLTAATASSTHLPWWRICAGGADLAVRAARCSWPTSSSWPPGTLRAHVAIEPAPA